MLDTLDPPPAMATIRCSTPLYTRSQSRVCPIRSHHPDYASRITFHVLRLLPQSSLWPEKEFSTHIDGLIPANGCSLRVNSRNPCLPICNRQLAIPSLPPPNPGSACDDFAMALIATCFAGASTEFRREFDGVSTGCSPFCPPSPFAAFARHPSPRPPPPTGLPSSSFGLLHFPPPLRPRLRRHQLSTLRTIHLPAHPLQYAALPPGCQALAA
jgi:hypothetical protein